MHLTKFRPRIKESFCNSWYQNLKIESQLNANYSFDNFLEGDANRLARSAGMAANKPGGTSFNPLLIFGGVGLGKTLSACNRCRN
jgi:chromosomal replication initiator protein